MAAISNHVLLELAYQTAQMLNARQADLHAVQWNNGESNTDMEFSMLACAACTEAWELMQQDHAALRRIVLRTRAPDIQCTFHTQPPLVKKIELKSSKNATMPGSTIRKLDINQPLIYCLRPKPPHTQFRFRCCQYHTAMGEGSHDLFQDRTPRPCVSFHHMPDRPAPYVEKDKHDWITYYAQCALRRIQTACSYSWQDDLVRKIQSWSIQHFIRNTSLAEFSHIKGLQS